MKILNLNNYKGTSLCIVSDFNELNRIFVMESLNNVKNFNKLDLLDIKPKNGNIKISQIRELQEFLSYKPNYSDKKIVIINNIHSMKLESANAMLKIIEEPPNYAIVIGTTNNWNNVINTIKSRMLKVNVSISSDLYEQLKNKFKDNIRYVKLFIKYDYGIANYILSNTKEEVNDIIENYIIDEKDFEFYLKTLTFENNEKNNMIKTFAYFKILKYLFNLKEIDFIDKLDEINSIKNDVEKLSFLKNISKLSSILIRDTLVSKMTSKWKYMWNLNLIEFLGIENYKFDVSCALDTLTYFNGIINSRVSNYNFNMEIYTHFIRLRQIYKK
ncbi:DNA polymerase III subunit delta' [Tepiditoga spiralis]|uniref:DNA polymerase III subunit delta n=1 Tax=Tepiditoga spiralis TaxID=2108365 RepID=A0A7G1G4G3_9BACT|nr:hypothetical protein [Tepiditoga spiralis]BBE31390.1 DNA polymerase III subunit delta' [Tepiditoga spiralis]